LEIQFTTGESPLGSVLVATTAKGVCAVSLRESEAGAEEYLRARFPKAEIRRDDAPLKRALDTVRERIAGRNFHDVLPLDFQGMTSFPSIYRGPTFSARSGTSSSRFRRARHGRISTLLRRSIAQKPRAQWLKHAELIQWPLWCHAIEL